MLPEPLGLGARVGLPSRCSLGARAPSPSPHSSHRGGPPRGEPGCPGPGGCPSPSAGMLWADSDPTRIPNAAPRAIPTAERLVGKAAGATTSRWLQLSFLRRRFLRVCSRVQESTRSSRPGIVVFFPCGKFLREGFCKTLTEIGYNCFLSFLASCMQVFSARCSSHTAKLVRHLELLTEI